MKSHWTRSLGLGMYVAVTLLVYIGMVQIQRSHEALLYGSPLMVTIVLYLLASLAFLVALALVERRGGLSVRTIWLIALLFRLPFFFASPALSDDVYRYLWDGHLAARGVSPYQHSVDSPALDAFEIPLRQQVNHSWMATPYLTAAQFLFRTLAATLPLEPLSVQVAMFAFDLLSAWLIARLLALAALPPRRIILYLWNPLVIVELVYSAHIDAWMICLALAAVYLTLSGAKKRVGAASIRTPRSGALRYVLAPIFLALATLTKLLPALLLPVLFWRWSWRQRGLYMLVTMALLAPAGMRSGWGLTGELNGTGLFGAIRVYIAYWNFNSGLFHWLERSLGAPGYGNPAVVARILATTLMLALLLSLWLLARKQATIRESTRLFIVPMALYFLLSPTVHPWYLLSLVAFLPFWSPGEDEPRRSWLALAPWLYLSGVLALSYATYLDPANPGEREWIRQAIWLPTILSLAITSAVLILKRPGAVQDEPGGLPAVLQN